MQLQKGVITKLSSSLFKREYIDDKISSNHQQFTRNPLAFTAANYFEIIPLIEISSLLDSENEEARLNYEEKILTDALFGFHVRPLGPVYIKATCKPATLGKILLKMLPTSCYDPIMVVEVDLVSKKYYQQMHFKNDDDDIPDTWQQWNQIHEAANFNPRIEVALVLSADVPFDDQNMICRWLGESVNMIVVPSESFMCNSFNYPILSKQNQAIFKLFVQNLRCTIAIETKELDPKKVSHYRDYLEFLEKFVHQSAHVAEQDFPRCPLQPLKDDLDYGVYETFELDKAKYLLYQKAIEAALIDMIPEDQKSSKKLTLMILGAGRGPLVRSVCNASKNTNRKIKIVIVEKNRSAVNTLRAIVNDLWSDQEIEIMASDMRSVKLNDEEKADILVSELLGSFGDNELSPECLDVAQHLLKADGISIPSKSMSYLRPVMSQKIHSMISKCVSTQLVTMSDQSRRESQWLIYLHNVYYIDEAKEVFEFVHPNKAQPKDNSRFKKLEFSTEIDCILHGFAGYFTSQLYKDIEISIHPKTHTKGLQSWYSIYFPIPEPMQLKKNEKIEVEFHRKCDLEKIWYEYQVLLPTKTKVINEGGLVHPILL